MSIEEKKKMEETSELKQDENKTETPSALAQDAIEEKAKTARAKKQLFLNYKGGTGKTSVSAAYGYYLAMLGKKVLLVDLDAQAHLTTCLDQEDSKHDKSLYSVMVKDEPISDIIAPTSLENMKIIPSSISLSAIEAPLFNMALREFQLRKALKTVEKDYDFIIMDSAPNINLLSLNAIMSADDILIPLLADFLSFHSLKILLETLASIERDFNFYVGRVCVFLNRHNPAYPICEEARDAVRMFYPQYLLKTAISESPDIIEASSLGKSIFEVNPSSKVAEDIRNLVNEVNGF